jgi:AcrR family transcriptional regulator
LAIISAKYLTQRLNTEKEMTKDKILKVALEEFSKYGYDAVSMNDLVKKLHVNKATIYYHYKDKRALYQAVVESLFMLILSNLKAAFSQKIPPEEALNVYIKTMVESIKKTPQIPSFALREIANFGNRLNENIVPHFEKELSYLNNALNQLDLKEEYKNINAYVFFSMINGTIFTFYAIQMSELSIGTNNDMKQNASKSLDHIASFISSVLLNSLCK